MALPNNNYTVREDGSIDYALDPVDQASSNTASNTTSNMVRDYQGKEYDPAVILALSKQIAASVDPKAIKGGVFTTKGESVGFNYDEATRLLGRAPNSAEQVFLDMARHLAKEGVTDLKNADLTETNRRFGSTFTGGGGTIYEIKKDASGNPVISTWSKDTSDKGAILGALAIAGLAFGVPALFGESLAGTAGLTASELATADMALGGLGGTAGATALAESAALGATGAGALATQNAFELANAGASALTETAGLSTLGAETAGGLLTGAETAAASTVGAETAAASTLGAETAGASTLGGTTGTSTLGSGTGLLTGGAETAVTGMGTGTGITAGSSGLGLNAAGTAGLGAEGLGAGLTTGTGLTGTGVLTGSTLGTGLLTGAGTTAGLTGTGVLTGSELGTGLLGTTGTGALTGTGVLTGSTLGTEVLGTGAGTAATTGGVTGLTNTANVGTGAVTTGVTPVTTTAPITTTVTPPATVTPPVTVTPPGLLTGLTPELLSKAISSALTTTGGLLQQQTSREAAQAAQAKIDAETAAAKQAAQFRPVGMTTKFGASQFTYDPVTGQMVSAGYKLTPEAQAQQVRLSNLANQGLSQAEQAQAQFAPLQQGAQSLFGLGNQYLAQSPEDVANKYIAQQMNLLAPSRELDLANLQNRLYQQGRSGLAVAQGGNLGATTPELQALYNARAQQDAQLAANAQQYGQQQVSFGAGLLGQGAGAMGQYYAGQQAAYAPYTAAQGQVQNLESQAQQAYNMSQALAQQQSLAGARSGELGLRGAGQSVALATGNAATTNPYATVLSGLGDPNSLISQGITSAVKSIWNT